MKYALEELRITAHDMAKVKDYSGAVDQLLDIKKQTRLYTWDVAFYIPYYQILEENDLEKALALIPIMNKSLIEAVSIFAIRLDDSAKAMAPFDEIYEKVKELVEKLLENIYQELVEYVENYKISAKEVRILKLDYVKNLEVILSFSETYLNCMGNLVEFAPVNVDYMWDFFKLNDEILRHMIPYETEEKSEKQLKKREELLQIIRLKDKEYQEKPLEESILPEIKSKWWQIGKK